MKITKKNIAKVPMSHRHVMAISPGLLFATLEALAEMAITQPY